MEELRTLLISVLNQNFIDMVMSGSKGQVSKIKVRPVRLKNQFLFQETRYQQNQVFHENLMKEDLVELWMNEQVWLSYKQIQIKTKDEQISVMMSKKGHMNVKRKQNQVAIDMPILNHDRKKAYLLEEGKPVDFLVELGVMTNDGKVVKKRYDKFRQINRYLEFVEDVLPKLQSIGNERELTIIDFGCGKSYLTFALYYYLRVLKGLNIHVIGLDLKKDVIAHCNELSQKCHYDRLEFIHGDIADFEGAEQVDMVVTLHACDTATDYALYKAVLWNASVILSVPCCQHELNQKIQSDALNGMLQYGLIKERFAALATDSMRGMLLESVGYKTQILEFIDMEHTPKNILIRAVRQNQVKEMDLSADYEELKQLIHGAPTLEKLLITMNSRKISMKK